MTIHYHGTPITPRDTLYELAGRHFCVSYADPRDVEVCHQIGQSVMLDNGAFTFWTQGRAVDWKAYQDWADKWMECPTTWAVIPDIIDGEARENDDLLKQWPFKKKGAPVWHLHEPIARLEALCREYPRVCFGSSAQYAEIGTDHWHARVTEAWNRLTNWRYTPWIHMLRGMSLVDSIYPFASVDSTDIARNHNRPQNGALKMAQRWDAKQCPGKWESRAEQIALV